MIAADLTDGIVADTWLAIGLPAVVALVTAFATSAVVRRHAGADRRRVRYAEAMATLAAWIEFPYRVRRRTSDDGETLTRLADRAHDLQERMAFDQAWISTESARVAAAYASARSTISGYVGPAINEAWTLGPVASPGEMVLGDWGPASTCTSELGRLQERIDSRLARSGLRLGFGKGGES